MSGDPLQPRATLHAVKVEPSLVGNAWYFSVEGYNTRAKVSRTK